MQHSSVCDDRVNRLDIVGPALQTRPIVEPILNRIEKCPFVANDAHAILSLIQRLVELPKRSARNDGNAQLQSVSQAFSSDPQLMQAVEIFQVGFGSTEKLAS